MKLFLPIIFLFSAFVISAQQNEPVTVIGDSLIGKRMNGQSVREVIGNVVMTQGDVKITSRRAIQYLSKNNVELIGNVIVTQDTITLKTERGFYYGNTKSAMSDTAITLNDGQITLTAKAGKYFFDEDKAVFIDSVELHDSPTSLYADTLEYFQKVDKAVSFGNVNIQDTSGYSIFADSLVHFRENDLSYAYENIYLKDEENNLVITGNYLEDIGSKNYSKITGDALLVQVDSTEDGTKDTLIISSMTMEAFNDSSKKLIATDSVKIVRGQFASRNSKSTYFREDERIFTVKSEPTSQPPVLWFENSQLVGDTVNVFLENSNLKNIVIKNNAFILTKIKGYDFRFDQISGKQIEMFFRDNELQRTIVDENVLSIYYLFEEDEPNGLIKSSATNAKIIFTDSEIEDVKLYGAPISEYHPEILIADKEKEFTLPSFNLFSRRPEKEELLSERKNKIFNILEEE